MFKAFECWSMFTLIEIEEIVGIHPRDFLRPLREAAMQRLKDLYEGTIIEGIGYVVLVVDVEVDPIGLILPRDGSIYHKTRAKLLIFSPTVQEVGEGEIVEITDFGAFVRVGPMDALLHISQIMDDYLSYDERHSILLGKKTGRKLEVGDILRFRVVAVSLSHGATGKISITTRQPYLGKIEWIKEELEKIKAKTVAGE
ncbi:MAG: DNA-directed RNA polymerase [Nitrososphaerota archaeon]|nr:DNA-directed RNA polymerase [Candidatus Geocrenenecus dongiae]